MTPLRRLRSLAAAGFLWVLLGSVGCESVGDAMIDSLLGIDADYTYRNDYRHTEATETRRWTMRYTEHLKLTSDLPGTHVVVNGEDLGPCPVATARPPRPVGIEETGFYPVHDVYKVKYKKLDNGRGRFVSENTSAPNARPAPRAGSATASSTPTCRR